MKEQEASPVSHPSTPVATERPNGTRRRFVVAGLAAAPLLVTLSAKPAFARQGTLANYGSAT